MPKDIDWTRWVDIVRAILHMCPACALYAFAGSRFHPHTIHYLQITKQQPLITIRCRTWHFVTSNRIANETYEIVIVAPLCQEKKIG